MGMSTAELYKLYNSEIVLNDEYLSKPVLQADPFIIMASDLDDAGMDDDDDVPGLGEVKIEKTENAENDKNKEEVLQRLLKATIHSDNEKQAKKLKKQSKK